MRLAWRMEELGVKGRELEGEEAVEKEMGPGSEEGSVSEQLGLGKAKIAKEDPRSVQERLDEVDDLARLVKKNDTEFAAA